MRTLPGVPAPLLDRSNLLLLLAFCLYLAVVVFSAAHHEVWRDEVRALSLARQAESVLDLFRQLKNEGHPVLWYLMLYLGSKVSASALLLKVLSVAVAATAVFLLFFFSPFQTWQKVLAGFGLFPLYEYSVMCRNYGISMLLVFIFCMLYRRWRDFPVATALVLVLLANTNAHSLILAGALVLCLLVEELLFGSGLSAQALVTQRLLPLLLVVAGVSLSVLTVLPDGESLVSNVRQVLPGQVATQLLASLINPGHGFVEFSWPLPPLVASVLLLLVALPLLPTPQLLVFYLATVLGLSSFFGLVYLGHLRHQGILWIALIAVFWLKGAAPRLSSPFLSKWLEAEVSERLLVIAAAAFLAGSALRGGYAVLFDLRYQMSSASALADFIARDASLKNAILIGEPDYHLEAIPYYLDNRIYFPRERKFARYAHFTRANAQKLTRSELLQHALKIREQYRVPVLIALGHFGLEGDALESERSGLASFTSGSRSFSYGKIFSWDASDDPRLLDSATKVTEFLSGASENFELYRID